MGADPIASRGGDGLVARAAARSTPSTCARSRRATARRSGSRATRRCAPGTPVAIVEDVVHHRRLDAQGDRARAAARARRAARVRARRPRGRRARSGREGSAAAPRCSSRATSDEAGRARRAARRWSRAARRRRWSCRSASRRAAADGEGLRRRAQDAGRATATCAPTSIRRSTSTRRCARPSSATRSPPSTSSSTASATRTRRTRAASSSRDGADSYEFHVETATHDYALNDLTSAKTVWRLTLVDDQGHEVAADAVIARLKERRAARRASSIPTPASSRAAGRVRFPRDAARRVAARRQRHQGADAALRRAAGLGRSHLGPGVATSSC